MKSPGCSLSFGIHVLVIGLALPAIGRGHNGEGMFLPMKGQQPMAPQRPAPPPIVEEIQPPRWSWIHWWEANRKLTPSRQSQGKDLVQNQVSEATQKKVVDALAAFLETSTGAKPEAGNAGAKNAGANRNGRGDGGGQGAGRQRRSAANVRAAARAKNPKLRSAALLALGRIGGPEAMDIIAEAARTEKDENVLRDAITALGLLDSPEAQKLLLEDPDIRDGTLDYRCAAFGLLNKIQKDSSDQLQSTVEKDNVNVGSIATWALQNRKDPRAADLFRRILANSKSSWLASDALLYLGRTKDPGTIPLLAELLLDGPGARQIAAYRDLDTAQRAINEEPKKSREVQADYERNLKEYERNWRQWQASQKAAGKQITSQPAPSTLQQSYPAKKMFVSGLEWTYASELRGSAAMALGMIDDQLSRDALLQAMNLPDDYYSNLFKGPALISLGKIGDAQSLKVLTIFLDLHKITLSKRKMEDSPLPGYAALAMGLYARPKEAPPAAAPGDLTQPDPKEAAADATKQGGPDRPEYRLALRSLGQHLADPQEKLELRTACALALGLSDRQEALEYLLEAAKKFRPTDDTLLGYSFLARAMLHDDGIIEPAKRFLATIKNRTDMNGVLGQRAAILALGLLDKEETIPILRAAWDINYYASREVIIALSLARSTSAGDMLLEVLEKSKDPAEQAFISLCIGEFYAKNPQSPLYRFLSDTNYMIKNENLRPYQELANEFLFNYLLGAFGDEWK